MRPWASCFTSLSFSFFNLDSLTSHPSLGTVHYKADKKSKRVSCRPQTAIPRRAVSHCVLEESWGQWVLQWDHRGDGGPGFLPALPPRLFGGGGLEAVSSCFLCPLRDPELLRQTALEKKTHWNQKTCVKSHLITSVISGKWLHFSEPQGSHL